MRIVWLVIATAISATEPASADKYYAVTPTGAAEVLFANKPQEVTSLIGSACINRGWKLVSSDNNNAVCQIELNVGQHLAASLTMGNSYSTPPLRFAKFNVVQSANGSRAIASNWIELQMAFGQYKRNDLAGPDVHNSMVDFMVGAGGQLPPGTRFPNHAMLGIKGQFINDGRIKGYESTYIDDPSPAKAAGVVRGDVITRIAEKQVNNTGSLMDALARATENPSYEVVVLRGGQKVPMIFEREFRPMVEQSDIKLAPVEESTAVVQQNNLSVADEIAKLAKLRSDGILTEQEFQDMKAKLLKQ